MRKKLVLIAVLLLFVAMIFPFAACAEEKEEENYPYTFGVLNPEDPFVEITLSNGDSIRMELFPWLAPKSVENFLTYVREGFYEGVAFHRIIQNGMIQTGGFEEQNGHLTKKAATHSAIVGEFLANEFTHPTNGGAWANWAAANNLYLAHTPGVLSMARTDEKNSATSEFFICSGNYPSWNGYYAAFGRVIDMKSMKAVLKVEKLQTGQETLYYGSSGYTASLVPLQKVFITSAKVMENTDAQSSISPLDVPWFTYSYGQ